MAARKQRHLLAAFLAVVLLAGLAYAYRPQPVPVDMVTVARGPMRVTIDEEGWTRVKELFTVSAPIAGRLLRVDVDAGDAVREEETLLATIQPSDPAFLDPRAQAQAEAELEAAEAALALADAARATAKVELEFARSELVRAETLAQRGDVSARALERARLDLRMRQAALDSAEADRIVREFQAKTARAALIAPNSAPTAASGPCCLSVKAPVSGVVLRVLRESEGVVASGAPLLEIGDLRQLEILVELLSQDAARVRVDAPVSIEDWGGPPLAGRVRRVEPFGFTKISALGIEEQRVNTLIDLGPKTPPGMLGHGYRVNVRIEDWAGEDVVTVPTGALFRRGGDWTVFVVADGVARARRVVIGHMNQVVAEVVDNLQPGEQVILHPSDRVAEGTRVTRRES